MIEWIFCDNDTDILPVPGGILVRSIFTHPQVPGLITATSSDFVPIRSKEELDSFLIRIETLDDISEKGDH